VSAPAGEVYSVIGNPGFLQRRRSVSDCFQDRPEYRDLFRPEIQADKQAEPRLTECEDGAEQDVRESYEEIVRQQGRHVEEPSGEVNTLYKKVGVKVKPVDTPRKDAPMDLGRKDWKERAMERQAARIALRGPDIGPFDHIFGSRTAGFPRGARLTAERLAKMNMGDDLLPNEVRLLQGLMFQREDALAWDFSEMSTIHEDVQTPYRIRTIPHDAWQVKSFQCPKKLEPIVIQIMRTRKNRGTLEDCDGQYRNPYFHVPKVKHPVKAEDYRLINNAQRPNAVTERDAYIPISADEFSERFAGRSVYSLFDLFSGYDQVPLHTDSRDMTAFQTPIGLLRQCTLPQGATNSVAVFIRTIMKILEDHFPEAAPFIDVWGGRGPRRGSEAHFGTCAADGPSACRHCSGRGDSIRKEILVGNEPNSNCWV
jgi:hypothetical protein